MYLSEAQFNIAYTGFTFPAVSHELSVVFMVQIQLNQYLVNMAPFELPHSSFCFCGPSTINVFFSLCGLSPEHSQFKLLWSLFQYSNSLSLRIRFKQQCHSLTLQSCH
jgi:hypothetical protein